VSKRRLVIVEDEAEIAELVQFHVQREGFAADIIHSGRVALEVIKTNPPDLVVLDLMLPDVDGLEVCRRLKWESATRHIPVLILSAKGEEADVVTGLELGADDYVTKPFSPRVLMARIKNITRRAAAVPADRSASPELPSRLTLIDGALVIDPGRHKVTVHGEEIDLTLTEFSLLHYLAQRPGFVRTRDQIIAAVHGKSTVLSSRTIDVHVTALRRKLGDLASIIQTVRGVGYRVAERPGD
jgi:two-component system phosphate regulon response regulator PhoB